MRIWNLPLLFIICLALIACGQQGGGADQAATLFPSVASSAPSAEPSQQNEEVAAPAQIEMTATPNISTWVIGPVIEEWQKPAINAVVQAYWSLLYHPPSGVPDCTGAAAYINTPFENFTPAVLQACQTYAENKYFVRWLPIQNHSVQYYPKIEFQGTDDEFTGVIVELDTDRPWTADAFYLPDGGYYGSVQRSRDIVRLFLRIDGDQWWIYAATLEEID